MWFFHLKKRTEYEAENKALHQALEKSNKLMLQLNQSVLTLQDNMNIKSDARSESGITTTVGESENGVLDEKELEYRLETQRQIAEEQAKILASKQRIEAEYIVSKFVSGYLDTFNLVDSNKRFLLKNNIKKLQNMNDDLLFKVVELYKLNLSVIIYGAVSGNNIIRILVFGDGTVKFSINDFPLYETQPIGIKFFKKVMNDIEHDIYSIPSTKNCSIYKVEGKKYAYILARSERDYKRLVRDDKCIPRVVDKVEGMVYVKTIKSNYVFIK